MHPSLTIHWPQPKLFFVRLTLGSARACVLGGSAHNFAAGLEDKVSAVPAMGAGWGPLSPEQGCSCPGSAGRQPGLPHWLHASLLLEEKIFFLVTCSLLLSLLASILSPSLVQVFLKGQKAKQEAKGWGISSRAWLGDRTLSA